MEDSDVYEDRRDESPILALIDQGVRFHAECDQGGVIRGSTGERHQNKNGDIKSEEHVRVEGTPIPYGMQKLNIGFAYHVLKSFCSL
jgi:hypothetical protein